MLKTGSRRKLSGLLLCDNMPSFFSFSLSQILTGARFPRHEDWSRAHHRFLYRCDVWGDRRQHPRQRFSRGPQKAISKAQSLWKCFPESVRTRKLPSFINLCLNLFFEFLPITHKGSKIEWNMSILEQRNYREYVYCIQILERLS